MALLTTEPDPEIVAELDRGDKIVAVAHETRPDVAVVDIDLPGLDRLTAADHLHRELPECRVLILTGLSQPGNLLRALKAHVRGFIVKDARRGPSPTASAGSPPKHLVLGDVVVVGSRAVSSRLSPTIRARW